MSRSHTSLSCLPSAVLRYLCESYLPSKEICAIGSTAHANLTSLRHFRIHQMVPLKIALRLVREEIVESAVNTMRAKGESDETLKRTQRNRYRRVMKKISLRCGRRPSSLLVQNRECTNDLRFMRDHMATHVRGVKFNDSSYVFKDRKKFTLRRIVFASDQLLDRKHVISFVGIKSHEWPRDLTSLEEVASSDTTTSHWCLPPTLRKLTLSGITKHAYDNGFHANLPSSLTYLQFPSSFIIRLDDTYSFPDGLETLIFGKVLCQTLKGVKLPKSLKYFDCGMFYEPSFLQNTLPPNLTVLKLSPTWNRSLALPFLLPDSITEMNLPRDYTHSIDCVTVFPSQLRKLNIEMTNQKHSLMQMNLPESLREVSIIARTGGFSDSLFNFSQLSLPDCVESLTLDSGPRAHYAAPQPDLATLVLPASLTYLKFEGAFEGPLNKIKWPKSLTKEVVKEQERKCNDGEEDEEDGPQQGSLHVDLGTSFSSVIHDGELPYACTSLRFGAQNARQCLQGDYFVLPPRVRTLHFSDWSTSSLASHLLPAHVKAVYRDHPQKQDITHLFQR